MEKNVHQHARTTLTNIKSLAQKRAPVLTGKLRRGIVVVRVSNGYMVYGKEYYTIFQEAGTKYFKGKWFMRSSINQEVPKFLNIPADDLLGL